MIFLHYFKTVPAILDGGSETVVLDHVGDVAVPGLQNDHLAVEEGEEIGNKGERRE